MTKSGGANKWQGGLYQKDGRTRWRLRLRRSIQIGYVGESQKVNSVTGAVGTGRIYMSLSHKWTRKET